jgi:hypothetical protein
MDYLSQQSKPNLVKTAREFNVPEGRLRDRWKRVKSLFQRQPNGRSLGCGKPRQITPLPSLAGKEEGAHQRHHTRSVGAGMGSIY